MPIPTCRLAFLSVLGSLLLAQGTQTASVAGLALDRHGRPMAQVRVRSTSEALQGARLAVSGSDGRFTLTFLPAGAYELELTREGHRTVQVRQQLGVGHTFAPKVVMAEEDAATVNVRALPPEMDLGEVQQAVNRRMTEDIKPLPAEQNLDDILQTFTPGIADPGVNAPRVRGAMSTDLDSGFPRPHVWGMLFLIFRQRQGG